MKVLLVLLALTFLMLRSDASKVAIHEHFQEEFQSENPEFFDYRTTGSKAKFNWKSGLESSETYDSKVLSLKLNPKDPAGPGIGPELISKKFTHFGSYSTRLKIPDPRKTHANVGAVVGYFTYHNDQEIGLSEIDFEWLIADPEVIYMGTWTGKPGKLNRIGRTINLAKGIIYTTEHHENHSLTEENLTQKSQTSPEKIEPIQGFDASAQFYTYGFDWYPDRIRWWMLHPTSADTVVLWDYQGELGIPQHPSHYRINFWHTDNWPVVTNPKALEKPKKRFELEVDWMGYRPF